MAFDLSTAKPVKQGFDLSTARPVDQLEQPGMLDGVGEVAKAVGSGLASTIGGGLIGSAVAPFTEQGTGAGLSQHIQQEGTFVPRTQAGQEKLQSLSEGVQFIVDKFRIPVSGVAGIIQLVEGKGLDEAVRTIESVQQEGLGETRAQQILAEGGDPLTATAARILPEAGVEIAGALTGTSGLRRAKTGVNAGTSAVGRSIDSLDDAIFPIADKVLNPQTAAKQKIAQTIRTEPGAVETAGKKIVDGRLVTDKLQTEAIKQGLPEKLVVDIAQEASPLDKRGMSEMLDIQEQIDRFATKARRIQPSDVVGNAIAKRYKVVLNVNKAAGSQIDNFVRDNMKGAVVNFDDAIDSFKTSLVDDIGVKMSRKNTPMFKGSDIEGLPPQKLVRDVIERIREMSDTDAAALHRLKRFIDNQVSYGKTKGLTAKTEIPFKKLRHDIDGLLDARFPEYDRLNTAYAETIGLIDELQQSAPKRIDLSGKNADAALGQLSRRLTSNAQSRAPLTQLIENLEAAAKKYSPKSTGKDLVPIGQSVVDLSDDVLRLRDFVNNIETVFGKPDLQANAFAPEVTKGINQALTAGTSKQGLATVALQKAADLADKAQGINKVNALKSFRRLLEE